MYVCMHVCMYPACLCSCSGHCLPSVIALIGASDKVNMNPSLAELLLKPCQVFGSVWPFDQVGIPLGDNSKLQKVVKKKHMHS